eukprot:5846347-Pyramimonas_sp.AAC.1
MARAACHRSPDGSGPLGRPCDGQIVPWCHPDFCRSAHELRWRRRRTPGVSQVRRFIAGRRRFDADWAPLGSIS